ncbi:MAG: TonB-dependent receptor, partial [Actinobacteria bacterium]|nr:TonB-dependent receptor [Actinomycetota bacterium]
AIEFVAYGRLATGVKARLSGWNWVISDAITSNSVNDPDTFESRIQFRNESGGVFSRGVELETSYRDVAGRAAYANVSYIKTAANCLDSTSILANPTLDADKSNCDLLANAPEILAKLGVSSQLLLDSFHVSTEVSYLSSRLPASLDQDETIDPYLGWNLVWYAPDIRGFDVTIGARNLLGRQDEPAQSVYNREADGVDVLRVPGPGREIFARVGYRFE